VQRFVALLREQGRHHISQMPREALDALLRRRAMPPGFAGCHFLLDEFQDTDDVQFQLVLRLATDETAGACRLTVVGDVDQAIFHWRGADSKILKALQARARPAHARKPAPRGWVRLTPPRFRRRPGEGLWPAVGAPAGGDTPRVDPAAARPHAAGAHRAPPQHAAHR